MFKYLEWIFMLYKLQNMKKEGGYLIIVYVVQDKHTFSRGQAGTKGVFHYIWWPPPMRFREFIHLQKPYS